MTMTDKKHKIVIRPNVEKWLKKLRDKNLTSKIFKELSKLETNPYYGEPKKGDLVGIYCIPIHDISGKYDIAYYLIQEGDTIVIVLIGTRENFYQELKRFLK